MENLWGQGTFDVCIFTTKPELHTDTRQPVNKTIYLNADNNLAITRLPTKDADIILEACVEQGYHAKTDTKTLKTTRQYSQMYALVRKLPDNVPINSSSADWDWDLKLQITMALSRLIWPTSICSEFTARVKRYDEQIEECVPGIYFLAYVIDPRENFLSLEDVNDLKKLMSQHSLLAKEQRNPSKDPIARALWLFEACAREKEPNLRWAILSMGLEALINTDKNNPTKQFCVRIPKLAEKVGMKLDVKTTNKMYDIRSKVMHGAIIHIADMEASEEWDLYKQMEALLRRIIRKAIEEAEFGAFLRDRGRIKQEWPV